MANVLIVADDNFRDEELVYPYYRMLEAGHEVVVAAHDKKEVKGKFGVPVTIDKDISKVHSKDFDALIIPGGFAPDKLRMNKDVLKLVREMNQEKVVAAICHAGWVLASADVIRGKKVTSYEAIKDDMKNAGGIWSDEEVVVDGKLITSRKPQDLPAFCKAILAAL